jgi:hypothetical protein
MAIVIALLAGCADPVSGSDTGAPTESGASGASTGDPASDVETGSTPPVTGGVGLGCGIVDGKMDYTVYAEGLSAHGILVLDCPSCGQVEFHTMDRGCEGCAFTGVRLQLADYVPSESTAIVPCILQQYDVPWTLRVRVTVFGVEECWAYDYGGGGYGSPPPAITGPGCGDFPSVP